MKARRALSQAECRCARRDPDTHPGRARSCLLHLLVLLLLLRRSVPQPPLAPPTCSKLSRSAPRLFPKRCAPDRAAELLCNARHPALILPGVTGPASGILKSLPQLQIHLAKLFLLIFTWIFTWITVLGLLLFVRYH